MPDQGPKAVSFVARSGSGKTTLIEQLISELTRRGYRVGAFKAISHEFEIDHPGKDSYRMTAAGADVTLIRSPSRLALQRTRRDDEGTETLLTRYFQDVDIVLVEGDKSGSLPKIELFRAGYNDPAELLCLRAENASTYIAVAMDQGLDLGLPLPRLDLNDITAICDFIVAEILSPTT